MKMVLPVFWCNLWVRLGHRESFSAELLDCDYQSVNVGHLHLYFLPSFKKRWKWKVGGGDHSTIVFRFRVSSKKDWRWIPFPSEDCWPCDKTQTKALLLLSPQAHPQARETHLRKWQEEQFMLHPRHFPWTPAVREIQFMQKYNLPFTHHPVLGRAQKHFLKAL